MARKSYNIKYLVLTIILAVVLATTNYYGSWPRDYESLTAAQKMEYLWTQINKDHSTSSFPSILGLGKLAAPELIGGLNLMTPGTWVSDQFIEGRPKAIHSVGLVGKVKFNWDKPTIKKLGLTGGFTESTDCIARISSAGKTSNGAIPNMVFKHLRNGVSSGNLFAGHGLRAQDTMNFFQKPLASHVPNRHGDLSYEGTKASFINWVFKKGPVYHGVTSAAEFGQYTSDGKKADKIVVPFTVVYNPKPDVQKECEGKPLIGENFGCLQELKVGRVLYTVWAVMSPKDTVTQDDVIYLGEVQLTDKFVTSKFGDEQLHFKHTYQPQEVELLQNGWDKIYNPDAFMDKEGPEKYREFIKGKDGIQKRKRLTKKYAKY